MKKTLAVACLVSLFTTAGAFASDTLSFGVDATYPPLESRDAQGQMVGFDIDLGNEICKRLAVKCVYVQSSFDGLIPGLLARKFDGVLSSLSVTEARQKQIDFSAKLSNPATRLVAKAGSGVLPTAAGLQGKVVGFEQGTIQEAYARAYWKKPGITLKAYPSQDQVYADMLIGRVDASLQDDVQAEYAFLKTPSGAGYAFAGPALDDPKILGTGTAIGLRKEDQDLKHKIDKAIGDMLADGTYKSIAAKYFDFDIYGG